MSDCTKNPQYPKYKSHFAVVVNRGDIRVIECDYCEKQLVHNWTTRFADHMTEESLTRLATELIQKVPLTKAETTLAEQVMAQIL